MAPKGQLATLAPVDLVHAREAVGQRGAAVAVQRDALAAAIAEHGYDPDEDPAAAYYTAWITALERLLAERGVTA